VARRILVVDDEADIRRLVQEALVSVGYDVATAANGKEAVRVGASFLPDLVLLDIMMPDADGFTVARWLREKPVELDTPIIFLTARREIDSKLQGFRAGGVDYITKPFHIRELMARIQVHLRQPEKVKDAPPSPLTEREREVVTLLARGRTYKQVANAMRLSQSTVRNHLHNVYNKLGVVDRAQAVIVSRDNGWI
jgi:DNA-binding response OmpR family regulator